MQHTQLASGAWEKLSFIEQMANIGSEVERSFKWKEKMKSSLSHQAFVRSQELLQLTIQSHITDKAKLKELLRVKECLADSLVFDNEYASSYQSWHSYFRAFNYAARLGK